MKYSKNALSFQDQANLLIARGLIVQNSKELEQYLQQVNYYRLSGYWYFYRSVDPLTNEECFKPGTTLNKITERYEFDRKLRLLIMDALERIEVSILRTRMVECHTTQYGPFGYTKKENYNPKFTQDGFSKLLKDIQSDEQRSHEEFIHRYRSKYSEEKYLPFWMVVELMSFGQLVTLYRNQDLIIKKGLADQFNLFPPVLDSWLLTLNYVRNVCAHHSRLWNRPLPLPISFPDKKRDPRWHTPAPIENNTIFSVLTVIQYLLSFIYPENTWKESLEQLIAAHPGIPTRLMGFPENWRELALWK